MIQKEIMEGMTVEQVMQQLQEIKKRRRAAVALANNAIKGYEKAVRVRDAKIKELKEEAQKQLADISDKESELKADMLKAATAENGKRMDEAQRALTELESHRSQMNARMESLNGKPPRCDEAYEAMEAAVRESMKADDIYAKEVRIIREFCEEAIESWKRIISSSCERGEILDRFFLDRARSQYSSEH